MPFPDFTPSTPEFVRELGERYAGNELIVYEGARLTYAEAQSRSAVLARGLLGAGVTKGTRVGLLMPNNPDFVVAWLAAARIGALLVPINTFYKAKELGFILAHADIEVLLTTDRFLGNDYLERLESCCAELARHDAAAGPLYSATLPYLRHVYVWGDAGRAWCRDARELETAPQAIDDAYLAAVEACVTPADPLMIIYSSGSTADPKGAIHTHGAALRHACHLNHWRNLEESDRMFSPMPFFWVGGLVFTLFSVMHKGACLISEELFEPGATLELLARERVTVAMGWPHYGTAMADHPTFRERDLSALRAGNIYRILPDGVRPRDPELRSNALGMTETCGPHSIDRMDIDLPEAMRGSFGRAPEGIEHKVVDPDTGDTLPPGEDGEICVRGYCVMQGQYKVEREDCFERDGFYRTGDGGHLDANGFLFFKARLGDLIKTGGANVTPREVEVVIDEQPEVQASYVVGLPHPDRGQQVVAAVVLNTGARLDADTLRDRLKAELSAYKVPARVFFCAKAEIPFTDSGKVDKRALIDALQARA